MYTQFFGNFLLSRDISLMSGFLTLSRKSTKTRKLGTLAIHSGLMTSLHPRLIQ